MTLSDSSVRRWLVRLKAGDEAAAQRIWEGFYERLVLLAHRRLLTRHRDLFDPEDIALSAFASFCQGVEKRRFPKLDDSHDLWRLLVSITVHKVLHVVRDGNRQKRGGAFRELKDLDGSNDAIAAIDQVVGREPSPEFAAEIAEETTRLMHALGDKELEQLACWKLEGFTNDEIAAKWERSTRTVERKLNLIRKIWLKAMTKEES